MCGLTGYIGEKDDFTLSNMVNALYHRGPDSNGVVSLRNNTLHMGHTRLSIIDLSLNGHQPMQSKNEKMTIVFNGEIYNYKKLKSTLPDQEWRGHSDTEVLVEAFSFHGIKKTLELIDGMYSIALYDHKEDMLYLIRDRAGEKPLYFGKLENIFFFGSELKSFYPHNKFKKKISLEALSLYFQLNYIPSPLSIYEGIFKVKPGHYIACSPHNLTFEEIQYWSPEQSYNKDRLINLSEKELEEKLEDLLIKSISDRMISDVKLGSFLSGGIDSSLITLFMQKISSLPINTFTIGFEDKKYNESHFAQQISKYLGTNHHEYIISNDELKDIVPLISNIFDEPFADPSQIPTYLVSKKAKSEVKVCLSGDGGDELFGGYYRYITAGKLHSINQLIPGFSRRIISSSLKSIPPYIWDSVTPFSPDKINKLINSLNAKTDNDLYNSIMVNSEFNIIKEETRKIKFNLSKHGILAEKMMLEDFKGYLCDDILVKVDRSSMACSLETRAPFLSNDIIDFSFQIPFSNKIKGTTGKSILRNILYKHIPKELVDRPKMGFSVPLDRWLRDDLRDYAEIFFIKKNLEKHSLLNSDLIVKKWNEHKTGKRSWAPQLWSILVFQMWFDKHIDQKG